MSSSNYRPKECLTNFEGALNLTTRTIYLSGEISEFRADILMKSMDMLEYASDDEESQITIRLTTLGGDVYSMMSIYDRIRSSGCRILTVSSGCVMSAGILIATAGDIGYRYAYENCHFMHHKGSFEVGDEHTNAMGLVKHYDAVQAKSLKMISDRTKKPLSYWKNLEKRVVDKFFTASEARTVGIIDHVIKNSEI